MIYIWRGSTSNSVPPLKALLGLCDSVLRVLPPDPLDATLKQLHELTTGVKKEAFAFSAGNGRAGGFA